MSTRSRTTRSTAAKPAPKAKPKSAKKEANGTQHHSETATLPNDNTGKTLTKSKKKDPIKSVECFCSKGDDGSPMIHCSNCRIWYHFTCVDISEPEAHDISVYICPPCTQSSGRQPAMIWEGDQALEECTDDETDIKQRQKTNVNSWKRTSATRTASPERPLKAKSEDESGEENGSEDDYIEKVEEPIKRETSSRRSRLAAAAVQESDDSTDEDRKTPRRRRLNRARASPPASTSAGIKRKNSTAAPSSGVEGHSNKRKKSNASSPLGDPTRKYCLGKLEELFKEVFLKYPPGKEEDITIPQVEPQALSEDHMDTDESENKLNVVEEKKEVVDLSEEDKEMIIAKSKQFAEELESAVFELYSEPDKLGNPNAGAKYKDRFLMLQFNLSKPDRIVIHRRIVSGNITPKEISLMSSTDLADEETKQSIKIAEKEALEHSILQKPTLPRAKITHKGLQDIDFDDVHSEVGALRTLEKAQQEQEQQEEEDKRERERLARQASAEDQRQQQRQRTMSMSIPPESPTVPGMTPTGLANKGDSQWGAPPPVPLHAISPVEGNGERPPLFTHVSMEDPIIAEPEMSLTDLINIDEEGDGSGGPLRVDTGGKASSADVTSASPVEASFPSAVTGISPFATKSQRTRAPSFDLNALWSNAVETSNDARADRSATPPPETPVVRANAAGGEAREDDGEAMELESVEADDMDFDMFLEDKGDAAGGSSNTPPVGPVKVEDLPVVWDGKISMPLDSSMPQEATLVARQIGGKPIDADSPLWHTLFPTEMLRIEGRVPVDKSVQYLLQMRLNPMKELYAVALVPVDEPNEKDFKTFCDFLISKNRHGLVFPWGMRPKEHHPGRELYMIPLMQADPLPEFVELLDDLKFPKSRSKDYLIGVWILNKGKLVLPPTPPAAVPAPPFITPVPSSHSSTPPVNISTFTPPHPPPVGVPAPLAMPGLPIAPSALAAEVASLTPEQIQNVLRTLASTTNLLPTLGSTSGTPPQPPIPGISPPAQQPPNIAQTLQWMNLNLPPPGAAASPVGVPPPQQPPYMNYGLPPPLPAHHHYQSPPSNGPYPPPSHIPYERHDSRNEYDFQPGPNYGRGGDHHDRQDRGHERGWRGSPGGRGRGRGQGGRGRGPSSNDDYHSRKPLDSGWPRRQRNDGQGGPW